MLHNTRCLIVWRIWSFGWDYGELNESWDNLSKKSFSCFKAYQKHSRLLHITLQSIGLFLQIVWTLVQLTVTQSNAQIHRPIKRSVYFIPILTCEWTSLHLSNRKFKLWTKSLITGLLTMMRWMNLWIEDKMWVTVSTYWAWNWLLNVSSLGKSVWLLDEPLSLWISPLLPWI